MLNTIFMYTVLLPNMSCHPGIFPWKTLSGLLGGSRPAALASPSGEGARHGRTTEVNFDS